MSFVADIIGFIDAAVLNAARDSFGAISGSFGGVITVMATLLVVMFGVAVSMGIYAVRTGDVFQLVLRIALRRRYLTLAGFTAILIILIAIISGGHLKFIFFPRVI